MSRLSPAVPDLLNLRLPDKTVYHQNDLDNRLKTAKRAGVSASVEYDAEGRMQRTVIGDVTTDLLYDGPDLVAEYDASGALQRRYVHGPGADEIIASIDGPQMATRTWMYADHLGSIVATADGNAVVTGRYTYGPNGEPAR